MDTAVSAPKFVVIESRFDGEKRVRAYDISFHVPGFRTHEHLHKSEVNVATLSFIYSPRRKLLEFESFYDYVLSFKDKSMTLEEASWHIIDDVFAHLEPLFCSVSIRCELNDGLAVTVDAKRGWRTFHEAKDQKSFSAGEG